MIPRLAAALALIAAAVLAVPAGPAWAQAPAGPLTISGAVVNGTDGGDPVEGLTVVLHRNTAEELTETPTAAGADGSFSFDAVDYDPEAAYGISVLYKGALYGLDLDLSAGPPPPVELAIYEPIRSDEVLTAELISVLINDADPASRTLSVLEIARLVNGSDLAYVPGPEPMQIIRFALPEGASELRVDTSLLLADVFQVDRGFGVAASVPPGTHEVLYSYRFPYSGAEQVFTRTLRYGAGSLRFVVPGGIAGIAASSVGEPEAVDIGQAPYMVIEAGDVPRGHALRVTLTDLPMPGLGDRAARTLSTLRWELAAPVALGVVVAAAAAYALWRNRRAAPVTTRRGGGALSEREAALSMIAELDALRRAEEIDDDEHRRRRSALTARLAAMRDREERGPGAG